MKKMMKQRLIKINHPVLNVLSPKGGLNLNADLNNLSNFKNLSDQRTSLIPEITDPNDRIAFLEKSLSDAKDKFYQLGYNEGKSEGMKELDVISERQSNIINKTLSKLETEYDNAIDKLAEPMIQLSIKIAEKVICDDLSNRKIISEFLETKIQFLLEKLKNSMKLKIYLQPSDIKELSTKIINNLSEEQHRSITFELDENLKMGECIIETEDFIVDGTILNQLDGIEKQLLESVSRKS
jgi:flagellar assembly protein FliH